jgi:hypothetical protein
MRANRNHLLPGMGWLMSVADGGMRANRNGCVRWSWAAVSVADGGMRANRNKIASHLRSATSVADGGMRANRNIGLRLGGVERECSRWGNAGQPQRRDISTTVHRSVADGGMRANRSIRISTLANVVVSSGSSPSPHRSLGMPPAGD